MYGEESRKRKETLRFDKSLEMGRMSMGIALAVRVHNFEWAEAEGLGRLTERVPNVRLNFGQMLCARIKQRVLPVSALSGYKMY